MNKDILVLLLQRDIKELTLLTEGFEEMTEFPKSLLRLAIEKGENILQSLKELENSVLPELGAIDYQSFGGKAESEDEEETVKEFFLEEKNIYDAPLDSELEPPVNPHEIEMDAAPVIASSEATDFAEITEQEKSELYTEKEQDLSQAADAPEITKSEYDVDNEENDELVESLVEGAEQDFAQENVEEPTEVEEEPEEVKGEFSDENNQLESIHDQPVQPTATLNDRLSNEDNSVSNNLANQKVDDIRLAINIGDRFRFQRELFGGNGEVLNKTLSYLNQLSKFSEAESFLKSKFGWGDDNVYAEEFLQIVKRRYL